jgi:hypothetical protein
MAVVRCSGVPFCWLAPHKHRHIHRKIESVREMGRERKTESEKAKYGGRWKHDREGLRQKGQAERLVLPPKRGKEGTEEREKYTCWVFALVWC